MYDDFLNGAAESTDVFPAVGAEAGDTAVDGLPPIPVTLARRPAHRRAPARHSWAGPAAGMGAVLVASFAAFAVAYEIARPPHRPLVSAPTVSPSSSEPAEPDPTAARPRSTPPAARLVDKAPAPTPTRRETTTPSPAVMPSRTEETPAQSPTPVTSTPEPPSPSPSSSPATPSETPSSPEPEATDE